MNAINMGGYTRVTKAQAAKLFNMGFNVMFTPCKCRPANYQGFWAEFNKSDKDRYNVAPDADLFSAIVDDYTLYQCQYNELGRYPAFYIRDRLLLDFKPAQDGNGTVYGVSTVKDLFYYLKVYSRSNTLAASQHDSHVTIICTEH